jgi:hypothetical protein
VYGLAANSDTNIQTDLIIMDFAKAFDKVPHQRLLCKLKFYGIKNQTLNWISAFDQFEYLYLNLRQVLEQRTVVEFHRI